jgi:hypothetical protein
MIRRLLTLALAFGLASGVGVRGPSVAPAAGRLRP